MRELHAFFGPRLAGVFGETSPGEATFQYTATEGVPPVSLSLPPAEQARPGAAYAYLDNLLPDLSEVRERWARERGQVHAGARGRPLVLADLRGPVHPHSQAPARAHKGIDIFEHLGLELARAAGVPASRSQQAGFLGQPTFIVQRWDRARGFRVHAEDLNHGPSRIRTCARRIMSPLL